MTTAAPESLCVLCSKPATEALEPPRRTMARGLDPSDPSYSVTVILPDIALCAEHSLDIRQGARLVGWCDDPRCRTFGTLGEASACGGPYEKLAPPKRS